MKIKKRYCKKCKNITKHTCEKEMVGFERVWCSVFTLGFSEMINDTFYMCTVCETETIVSK